MRKVLVLLAALVLPLTALAQTPTARGSADPAQLKRLADAGDASAQLQVGADYAKAGNYTAAVHYYKLAADQGSSDAQVRLAGLTCNGIGVPKNVPECVRIYRQAANNGNTTAQVNLAARDLMADGVPANYDEAVRLARLAADAGNPMGQFLLGMCHELGAGVPKNLPEATRLYKLSAAQGNTSAVNALNRLAGKIAPSAPAVSVTTLSVPLQRAGGVFTVPAVMNGAVSANFIVDSGASDVVVPEGAVQMLRNSGQLADSDFTGVQNVKIANGAVVQAKTFILRSLSVRGRLLEHVKASVAPPGSVPLLGQSFLEHFTSWSIDNERHMLLLREKSS